MVVCPISLLGRDLLSKLEAKITFKNGDIQLLVPETKAIEARTLMLEVILEADNSEGIPEAVENAVTPLVWASGTPGCS